MTDFGPLIANPSTLRMGAAAQLGVFVALYGAMLLGFNVKEAASIGIIGGADGPTAIYLTTKLAPHLLGAIAVAAYSYMSLVPLIQPPIMKLFTTQKERESSWNSSVRYPSLKNWRFRLWPLFSSASASADHPADGDADARQPVPGIRRDGSFVRYLAECPDQYGDDLPGNRHWPYHGSRKFLNVQTLMIICLGLVAFAAGTAAGVLFGKLMYYTSGGKVNPLIGSAGVSAVPMAARVSQIVGQKANPANFLLMHAMGPNVSGVIGTAVAAGTMLAMVDLSFI